MVKHQIDQIEAIARHEEAISGLYAACAASFSEHEDFWRTLAEEETEHASWVRKLRKLIELGKSKVNRDRFKIKPIETSIKYIEGYTKQAQRNELTLLSALSIASDIEHALIEKKFLEVYDSDDEHVKKTLTALFKATDAHRKRVDEFLNKVRQAG